MNINDYLDGWCFIMCVGTIPSTIGSLTSVTHIDMNNNIFAG